MAVFGFGRRNAVGRQYNGGNVSVMLPRYTTPPERNTRDWLEMFGRNPRLAVVDRIASDLSTCAGKLYRKDENGEEVEITDHPFLNFMAHPNPLYEMTSGACWRLQQIYLELKGEGYFVYEFDALGRPVELWPLPTHSSNPVEKGSDINDHVINDPVVFFITGVFLDEDQSDILERMWKEKDVVEYTGRTRISDCVITSFKSDISADNKNGSKFTVSLKVINRVSAEYVASGEQMMSAQDANASKKVSKSQTKSTTADGLHTTVSQTISSSAYSSYVNSYANKAASSSGPSGRTTRAYSAA